MPLDLPSWLPAPVVECVAGHFPVGNEDAMRRCGDYLSDQADWLRTQAEHYDNKATLRHIIRGQTGDSAEEGYRQTAEYFRAQADDTDTLAEEQYEGANSLEVQKWTVIGFAVILTWTLAHAAITFTFGGALEAYIATMRTKTAVRWAWAKMLQYLSGQSMRLAAERGALRLAGKMAAIGAIQGGGINAAVQLNQVADGDRDEMDRKAAGIAAGAGGIGGGVGMLFGRWFGNRWAIPATTALAGRSARTGVRLLVQVSGTAVVGAGGGIAGGLAGAAAALKFSGEDLTLGNLSEGLLPAITGGFVGAAAHGAAGIRAAAQPGVGAAPPVARGEAASNSSNLAEAVAALPRPTAADADSSTPPAGRGQMQLEELFALAGPEATGDRSAPPSATVNTSDWNPVGLRNALPDNVNSVKVVDFPSRPPAADPVAANPIAPKSPEPHATPLRDILAARHNSENSSGPKHAGSETVSGTTPAPKHPADGAAVTAHPAPGESPKSPSSVRPERATVTAPNTPHPADGAPNRARPAVEGDNTHTRPETSTATPHPADSESGSGAGQARGHAETSGDRTQDGPATSPKAAERADQATETKAGGHSTDSDAGSGAVRTRADGDPGEAPAAAKDASEQPIPANSEAAQPTARAPRVVDSEHIKAGQPDGSAPKTSDDSLAPTMTAVAEPKAPAVHLDEHGRNSGDRPAAAARPRPAGKAVTGEERPPAGSDSRAAPGDGPPRVSAPKPAAGERPPAVDPNESSRGRGQDDAPSREPEPEHGRATDDGPEQQANDHPDATGARDKPESEATGKEPEPEHTHSDEEGVRTQADDDPEATGTRSEPEPEHARADDDGDQHRGDEQPDAGEDSAKALARAYRAQADDILMEYESRDWSTVSDQELKAMLFSGNDREAALAVIEVINRGEGKVLRWTQVMGMLAVRDGHVGRMQAGEGKTLVFQAASALRAARGEPVRVLTTMDTLALEAYDIGQKLFGNYGFDIRLMNPDNPYAPVAEGQATISFGTLHSDGFGELRGNVAPGRIKQVDEVDAAVKGSVFILSEGAGNAASPEVTARVEDVHGFLQDAVKAGLLSEADFVRAAGASEDHTTLTGSDRAKVEHILGGELTAKLEKIIGRIPSESEAHRIAMAATAKWRHIENDDYVVWHHPELGPEFLTDSDGNVLVVNSKKVLNPDSHKVYIIDQTTHKVMFDAETSTESRWNGGLAQAVEAKHGIRIRADPTSTKTVTVRELFSSELCDEFSGLSATTDNADAELRQIGTDGADKSTREIIDIPRLKPSELEGADPANDIRVGTQGEKHEAMADGVAEMHATGRPIEVICDRNSEVAAVSAKLTARGIEHVAVDAKWFLEHGVTAEADLLAIFKEAGKEGMVLVINRQGARGVDIPISPEINERGGLHVLKSSRSAEHRDIDIQAENRTARSGGKGSVQYYIALDDPLFAKSPQAQISVIRYIAAETQHESALAQHQAAVGEHRAAPTTESQRKLDAATNNLENSRNNLNAAEADIRGLVSKLQPSGVVRPTADPASAHLPNAPPASGHDPAATPASGQPRHRPPAPPPQATAVTTTAPADSVAATTAVGAPASAAAGAQAAAAAVPAGTPGVTAPGASDNGGANGLGTGRPSDRPDSVPLAADAAKATGTQHIVGAPATAAAASASDEGRSDDRTTDGTTDSATSAAHPTNAQGSQHRAAAPTAEAVQTPGMPTTDGARPNDDQHAAVTTANPRSAGDPAADTNVPSGGRQNDSPSVLDPRNTNGNNAFQNIVGVLQAPGAQAAAFSPVVQAIAAVTHTQTGTHPTGGEDLTEAARNMLHTGLNHLTPEQRQLVADAAQTVQQGDGLTAAHAEAIAQLGEQVLALGENAPQHMPDLAAIEAEVLTLVANDVALEAICATLGMTQRAVRGHIARAGMKLGTRGDVATMTAALSRGQLAVGAPDHSRPLSNAVAHGTLTPREVEVLELATVGLSPAAIAEQLTITKDAAAAHLARAGRKLGAVGLIPTVVQAVLQRVVSGVGPQVFAPQTDSRQVADAAPAVADPAPVAESERLTKQAVAAELFDAYGVEVLGLDKACISVATALSVRNAIVDAFDENPFIRLDVILVAPMAGMTGAVIWDAGSITDTPPVVMVLNENLFGNPEEFRNAMDMLVRKGRLMAPTGDPVYDSISHEMSHLRDQAARLGNYADSVEARAFGFMYSHFTGLRAAGSLPRDARFDDWMGQLDGYSRGRKALRADDRLFEAFDAWVSSFDSQESIEAWALRAGLSTRDGKVELEPLYQAWLQRLDAGTRERIIQAEPSSKLTLGTLPVFNPAEALAEANNAFGRSAPKDFTDPAYALQALLRGVPVAEVWRNAEHRNALAAARASNPGLIPVASSFRPSVGPDGIARKLAQAWRAMSPGDRAACADQAPAFLNPGGPQGFVLHELDRLENEHRETAASYGARSAGQTPPQTPEPTAAKKNSAAAKARERWKDRSALPAELWQQPGVTPTQRSYPAAIDLDDTSDGEKSSESDARHGKTAHPGAIDLSSEESVAASAGELGSPSARVPATAFRQLLERYVAQDRRDEAIAVLRRQFGDRVFRWISTAFAEPRVAQEIADEAFAASVDRLTQIPDRDVEAWVIFIARNLMPKHAGFAQLRQRIQQVFTEAGGADELRQSLAEATTSELQRALAELNDTQRTRLGRFRPGGATQPVPPGNRLKQDRALWSAVQAFVVAVAAERGAHSTIRVGSAELNGLQLQLLDLAARGLSNEEIAERWGISTTRVAGHFLRIAHRVNLNVREAALDAAHHWFTEAPRPNSARRAPDAQARTMTVSKRKLYRALTKGEQELFRMAVAGRTDAEIAERWGISANDVIARWLQLADKLGIEFRSDLLDFVAQAGTDPSSPSETVGRHANGEANHQLTDQQVELLRLLARGWVSNAIDEQWHAPPRTAEKQLTSVAKQFGIPSRGPRVVAEAIRRGIIDSRHSESAEVTPSPRDIALIELAAEGMTYSEIAKLIGRTPASVSEYFRDIRHLLGAKTGSEMVALSITLVDSRADETTPDRRQERLRKLFPQPTPAPRTLPRPDDPRYTSIDQWLKALRRHFEMTQEKFSERAGTATSTVSRMERGLSKPRIVVLRTLRDNLGFPNEVLVKAIECFYARPNAKVVNPAVQNLFWNLIATRQGSREEAGLQAQIYNEYAWIARAAAPSWAESNEHRKDLVQLAARDISIAILNFAPVDDFTDVAWSTARYACMDDYFERRFRDMDESTRKLVVRVETHLRSFDEPKSIPDTEIAQSLNLELAQVSKARAVLEQRLAAIQPLSKDFSATLRQALSDLPDRELAEHAVRLHLHEGLPLTRVARRLGISPEQAEHIVGAAVQKLQTAFADLDPNTSSDGGEERTTPGHRVDPVAIDFGEPDESPAPDIHITDIAAGDHAAAQRVERQLADLLDGWSDPEYIREIAEAVGASVRWGQGTISVTAVLTESGLRVGLVDITGDHSYVQADWHLGSTPGPVERAARPPVAASSEELDLKRWADIFGDTDEDEIPPYQREVGKTRRAVVARLEELRPRLGRELIDSLARAVSELVTNAKKHLQSNAESHGLTPEEVLDVTVSGTGAEREVRVTVTNEIAPGTAAKLPKWTDGEQDWDREGGRGTQIMIAESTVAVRRLTFANGKNTIEQSVEYHLTPTAGDIAAPHSRSDTRKTATALYTTTGRDSAHEQPPGTIPEDDADLEGTIAPIRGRPATRQSHDPGEMVLSRIEADVLDLVARNMTFASIVTRLGIPESQVWAHIAGAGAKLGTEGAVATMAAALNRGELLIGEPDDFEPVSNVAAHGTMSSRQVQAVHWAATGLTPREIAERMGVTKHTVKNHLARAARRLGVSGEGCKPIVVQAILQRVIAFEAPPRVVAPDTTTLPEIKARFDEALDAVALGDSEKLDTLRTAMDQLGNRDQQRCLELRHRDKLTFRQIAAELEGDRTEDAIKQLHRRAVRALAGIFDQERYPETAPITVEQLLPIFARVPSSEALAEPEAAMNWRDEVESRLRQAILSGQLAADRMLPAAGDLAEKLNLSKSSVSKTYLQLSTEGLLVSRHAIGTFVTDRESWQAEAPDAAEQLLTVLVDVSPEIARIGTHRNQWRILASALRSAIVSDRLFPGQRMPKQAALAEQLGMATANAVSKAYHQLSAEGYVDHDTRLGTEVAPSDRWPAEETREPYELLDILTGSMSNQELADTAAAIGWRGAVASVIRNAISSGTVAPGTLLPSARELAERMGSPSGALVAAYRQLAAEGYVVARRGSGTVVADPGLWPETPVPEADRPITPEQLVALMAETSAGRHLAGGDHRASAEDVVSALVEAILSGQLPEGRLLASVRELAQHPRMPSKSSLANAYRTLSEQGYVTVASGAGTVVASRHKTTAAATRTNSAPRIDPVAIDLDHDAESSDVAHLQSLRDAVAARHYGAEADPVLDRVIGLIDELLAVRRGTDIPVSQERLRLLEQLAHQTAGWLARSDEAAAAGTAYEEGLREGTTAVLRARQEAAEIRLGTALAAFSAVWNRIHQAPEDIPAQPAEHFVTGELERLQDVAEAIFTDMAHAGNEADKVDPVHREQLAEATRRYDMLRNISEYLEQLLAFAEQPDPATMSRARRILLLDHFRAVSDLLAATEIRDDAVGRVAAATERKLRAAQAEENYGMADRGMRNIAEMLGEPQHNVAPADPAAPVVWPGADGQPAYFAPTETPGPAQNSSDGPAQTVAPQSNSATEPSPWKRGGTSANRIDPVAIDLGDDEAVDSSRSPENAETESPAGANPWHRTPEGNKFATAEPGPPEPSSANHPHEPIPARPSRTEYDGAELVTKFHPEFDEFWQRPVEVVVLGENEDGLFIGPDGDLFTTGLNQNCFLLLRSGKIITTADGSAEHPNLLYAYISKYADDNERRIYRRRHGPNIIAGGGYWRLVEGKPEIIGIFSGLIIEHATKTPKFWAQVRHRLSQNFDLSSIFIEFDNNHVGGAWQDPPENEGEYSAEELVPGPSTDHERSAVTKKISEHLRGGNEEFWFEVEHIDFPHDGGLSIAAIIHPVLGEPAEVTIDIDRAGTPATARYRHFHPGPEPERTVPAFRIVHEVLTQWLTASGIAWSDDTLPLPSTATAPTDTPWSEIMTGIPAVTQHIRGLPALGAMPQGRNEFAEALDTDPRRAGGDPAIGAVPGGIKPWMLTDTPPPGDRTPGEQEEGPEETRHESGEPHQQASWRPPRPGPNSSSTLHDRVAGCVPWATGIVRMLGNDAGTIAADDETTGLGLEDALAAGLKEIHPDPNHPETDPFASYIEDVREGRLDTAVFVVDDGDDAHVWVITHVDGVEGNVLVFDKLIEGDNHRARPLTQWNPTYNDQIIQKRFVATFTPNRGALQATSTPAERNEQVPSPILGAPHNNKNDDVIPAPINLGHEDPESDADPAAVAATSWPGVAPAAVTEDGANTTVSEQNPETGTPRLAAGSGRETTVPGSPQSSTTDSPAPPTTPWHTGPAAAGDRGTAAHPAAGSSAQRRVRLTTRQAQELQRQVDDHLAQGHPERAVDLLREDLAPAIAELTNVRFQQALTLRFVRGLNRAEAAAEVGVAIKTFEMRELHAIRAVAGVLRTRLEQPEVSPAAGVLIGAGTPKDSKPVDAESQLAELPTPDGFKRAGQLFVPERFAESTAPQPLPAAERDHRAHGTSVPQVTDPLAPAVDVNSALDLPGRTAAPAFGFDPVRNGAYVDLHRKDGTPWFKRRRADNTPAGADDTSLPATPATEPDVASKPGILKKIFKSDIKTRFYTSVGGTLSTQGLIATTPFSILASGGSLNVAGWTTSLAFGTQFIVSSAAGPIADGKDPRQTLKLATAGAAGVGLASLAYLGTGLPGTVGAIIVTNLSVTALASLIKTANLVYAKQLASKAEGKTADNLKLLENALGSAGGRSMTGLVQSIPLLPYAATAATNTLYHLALNTLPAAEPGGKIKPSLKDGFRELWRDRFMRGFLSMNFPALFVSTTMGTHMAAVATANHYSVATLSAVSAANSIGLMIAYAVPQKLVDRVIDRPSGTREFDILSKLSWAGPAIAYATTGDPIVVGSLLGVVGFMNAFNNKIFNAHFSRVVDGKVNGSAWAALDTVGNAGGFLGGAVIGSMLSSFGSATGWIEAALMAGSAVGGIAVGRADWKPKSFITPAAMPQPQLQPLQRPLFKAVVHRDNGTPVVDLVNSTPALGDGFHGVTVSIPDARPGVPAPQANTTAQPSVIPPAGDHGKVTSPSPVGESRNPYPASAHTPGPDSWVRTPLDPDAVARRPRTAPPVAPDDSAITEAIDRLPYRAEAFARAESLPDRAGTAGAYLADLMIAARHAFDTGDIATGTTHLKSAVDILTAIESTIGTARTARAELEQLHTALVAATDEQASLRVAETLTDLHEVVDEAVATLRAIGCINHVARTVRAHGYNRGVLPEYYATDLAALHRAIGARLHPVPTQQVPQTGTTITPLTAIRNALRDGELAVVAAADTGTAHAWTIQNIGGEFFVTDNLIPDEPGIPRMRPIEDWETPYSDDTNPNLRYYAAFLGTAEDTELPLHIDDNAAHELATVPILGKPADADPTQPAAGREPTASPQLGRDRIEMLHQFADDLSNKEIARSWDEPVVWVKKQTKVIAEKLGTADKLGTPEEKLSMLTKAVRYGLFEPDGSLKHFTQYTVEEIGVLAHRIRGTKYEDIARLFDIRASTVGARMRSIRTKLHVASDAAAAARTVNAVDALIEALNNLAAGRTEYYDEHELHTIAAALRVPPEPELIVAAAIRNKMIDPNPAAAVAESGASNLGDTPGDHQQPPATAVEFGTDTDPGDVVRQTDDLIEGLTPGSPATGTDDSTPGARAISPQAESAPTPWSNQQTPAAGSSTELPPAAGESQQPDVPLGTEAPSASARSWIDTDQSPTPWGAHAAERLAAAAPQQSVAAPEANAQPLPPSANRDRISTRHPHR
ncbi:LuxR C-terminal-related transcriptional regulator [Nocardia sp. NPDC057440]|uniref:LuxR C-terminal-related transcriptional regulator n=1 Tax=Nocardia sp. NPDC057440 TaxID=3346134 RepID=UPI00367268C0